MKNLLFGFGLLCAVLTCAPAANATSITYTTTGSGSLSGTDFAYIDPTGFLAFDTGLLTPTTSTDLFFLGTDYGALTAFEFFSPTSFALDHGTTFGVDVNLGIPYQISALIAGESVGSGTLTISDTPESGVPEPSSLVLVSTGAIAAAGSMRRRFLRG